MVDYYVSNLLGPVCLNSSFPKNSKMNKLDTEPLIESSNNDLNEKTLDQIATIISPIDLN